MIGKKAFFFAFFFPFLETESDGKWILSETNYMMSAAYLDLETFQCCIFKMMSFSSSKKCTRSSDELGTF